MSELATPDLNGPKKPAIARFHVKAVEQTFRSQQEGRPIYEEQEFVEILIPGDRRSMVVERVNDEHKARWPREYEAFKAGREAPLEGTPLRNWPNSQMTTARVEELVYFNIRTVEELAAVSDLHLPNLGMGGRSLRQAAITFLEVSAKGTAPLERMVAENFRLTDENERLSRDLTAANAEITRLRDQLRMTNHAGA